MDAPPSPPKRVTRSRAAKATDAAPNKIVTTAARAGRSVTAKTPAASTAAIKTATKRKLRSDEMDDDGDDELATEASRTTRPRGRPAKTVETRNEAAPKPRGRPAKKLMCEAPAETTLTTTRAARTTRTVKTQPAQEAPTKPATRTRTIGDVPAKPTTRTRAASTTTKAAPVKKTVKFAEELEKENVLSAPTAKTRTARTNVSRAPAAASEPEPATTGLRGRPVRKAALPVAARATRAKPAAATAASKVKEDDAPVPLGPKNITQATRAARHVADEAVESEDEIAGAVPPQRPLMKGPIKPSSVRAQREQATGPAEENEEDAEASVPTLGLFSSPAKRPHVTLFKDVGKASTADGSKDNTVQLNFADLHATPGLLASPARRPPTTPFKDTMKSPARRAPILNLPKDDGAGQTDKSHVNPSRLLSPAKRPKSPMKLQGVAAEGGDTLRPQMQPLLFSSPAKRPLSPIKLAPQPGAFARKNLDGLEEAQDALHPCGDGDGAEGSDAAMVVLVNKSLGSDQQDDSFTETQHFLAPTAASSARKSLSLGNKRQSSPSRSPSRSPVRSPARSPARSPTRSPTRIPDSPTRKPASTTRKSASPTRKSTRRATYSITEAVTPTQKTSTPTKKLFPGRRSSILTRSADPALKKTGDKMFSPRYQRDVEMSFGLPCSQFDDDMEDFRPNMDIDSEDDNIDVDNIDTDVVMENVDAMEIDNEDSIVTESSDENLVYIPDSHWLRLKDQQPLCDPDSELDSDSEAGNSPRPSGSRVGKKNKDLIHPSPVKKNTIADYAGFTPLVEKVKSWQAGNNSPLKTCVAPQASPLRVEPTKQENTSVLATPVQQQSPPKTTFFDEAITAVAQTTNSTPSSITPSPSASGVPFIQQDFDIAAETNEIATLKPTQLEHHINGDASIDDSTSEASQEYGDENETPIDPRLLTTPARSIITPNPRRPGSREVHTVCRVPLKPADESTPVRAGSFSARVIPYSYSADGPNPFSVPATPVRKNKGKRKSQATVAPESQWSMAGTPARTPHKNLDKKLLRGAVCYVDVKTDSGEDARGIFEEVLLAMGARCVGEWNWDPETANGDASKEKVGITHLIYRNGAKKTLEGAMKASVVQCIGVNWVLDCERENKWLDEASYMVPEMVQHRRRMAKPVKKSTRDSTALKTPGRRRDSQLWERTPEDQASTASRRASEGPLADIADEEPQWMLTPVPKTPAPEAVARYAANVMPETPGSTVGDESSLLLAPRTCPPKRAVSGGVLRIGEESLDDATRVKLMFARRKSLQYAPKVASPLGRMPWKPEEN